MLQAEGATHTIKVVAYSLKASPILLRRCKSGDYSYSQVLISHYRAKGSVFLLILPTNGL